MMTRRGVALFILALQVGTTWARRREDGNVVPDTAWRKSAGSFGAILLIVDEPKKFFENAKDDLLLRQELKVVQP